MVPFAIPEGSLFVLLPKRRTKKGGIDRGGHLFGGWVVDRCVALSRTQAKPWSSGGLSSDTAVMSYIMVDIEADGPIPRDHSMVCFGAVVVQPGLERKFYRRL